MASPRRNFRGSGSNSRDYTSVSDGACSRCHGAEGGDRAE